MTPKQAQKWAAALRSGKYKQGTTSLYHEGSYCCLGVLCELNGETKFTTKTPSIDGSFMGTVGLPSAKSHPKTKKQIGDRKVFGVTLDCLNDNGHPGTRTASILINSRLTFDEIADLIELKFVHGAEG